jgi:hypothetical protein
LRDDVVTGAFWPGFDVRSSRMDRDAGGGVGDA